MFSFQGGPVVEIFSGQGKDPVAKWKLNGGPFAIRKELNNEVKGFVYCLEGSSQTVKMQMPASTKMTLGLVQRFFVLQIYVPLGEDFSIELTITDSEHLKKRVHISTVHKEVSASQFHAKIPFAELKRDVWSTLCIDLVSIAEKLFKGFLTLDIITLFATCKVRRIFTMRPEPADDFESLIPRSCHFPPHVNHVTQLLSLQKMKLNARAFISCQVLDQPASDRTSSYGRTKPQGVLRTASGYKVSRPSLQTVRKSGTVSESVLPSSNMGSKGKKQEVAAASQSSASLSENLLHEKPSYIHFEGYVPSSHRMKNKTREKCSPPSSWEETRQRQPSNQRTQQIMAGDCSNSPSQQDSEASLTSAESLSWWTWPDQSRDLQENDEGSEPQLTLEEGASAFQSQAQPLSQEQILSDQEWMETGSEQIQSKRMRRHEAPLEDDFIGSESNEEEDDQSLTPAEPGGYDHSFSRLQLHDDEELQLLASLKRQQEEDECSASGVSASQIHNCNVSTSINSDDTATWTQSSMPADQGRHYQKEMNSLHQSNPRDWMDVLSPPINPLSQQRRSGEMWNNPDNPVKGGYEAMNGDENDEENLNLLYDCCLNCYFDPATGKYYKLV